MKFKIEYQLRNDSGYPFTALARGEDGLVADCKVSRISFADARAQLVAGLKKVERLRLNALPLAEEIEITADGEVNNGNAQRLDNLALANPGPGAAVAQ